VKSEENARAAEITQVIEIGRGAGDDEHRRAEARQVFLTGPREQ
jgi:hypothetical protein